MCINPFKALGLGGGSPAHMLPQHKQQVAAPVPRQDYITPEESALLRQDQLMSDAARMGNRRMRIDLNTNTGGSGLRIM